ncbi:efflux RND transporter periplasmic adaptor subunit [Solidesulfovibrio sp.]|uniref:efflux RND transporter periplasmic adaptor subunit n=1 Tax=Solidesulfovibrio sp. TaxID=2910990 RepID=UPI002636B2D4|nr:efflux RND transporter periplasmic adaptor subunit [Solidesulfovibrio sp.]
MPRSYFSLFLLVAALSVPGRVPAQTEHAGHAMPQAGQGTEAPAAAASPHAGHNMPMPPDASSRQPAPPAPVPTGSQGQAGGGDSGGHAGHVAPPPTVTMGPDIMRAMGVSTVVAAKKPLQRALRATGRVELDESTLVAVTTKVEGWVEKLYADSTGKPVRKGETLAAIYSPEVMAVEMEYLRLLSWADSTPAPTVGADPNLSLGNRDARALLGAARDRLRLYDVGQGLAAALERTRRPVRTFALASPVDGFVVRKAVIQGGRVMPGETLLELADLSKVWVVADVYPQELPWVGPGTKATLRLAGLPDAFPATVDYIYPTLADETRTAKVRFVLANPKNVLRPGQYAQAEIAINLGQRLVVPREAVIDTGERQVAYVAKSEGVFEMRHVTTGVEAGEDVEVVSGLAAGDKVAAAAAFLIDSETRLRGGSGGGGHHH